jgi:hypothetical protein
MRVMNNTAREWIKQSPHLIGCVFYVSGEHENICTCGKKDALEDLDAIDLTEYV